MLLFQIRQQQMLLKHALFCGWGHCISNGNFFKHELIFFTMVIPKCLDISQIPKIILGDLCVLWLNEISGKQNTFISALKFSTLAPRLPAFALFHITYPKEQIKTALQISVTTMNYVICICMHIKFVAVIVNNYCVMCSVSTTACARCIYWGWGPSQAECHLYSPPFHRLHNAQKERKKHHKQGPTDNFSMLHEVMRKCLTRNVAGGQCFNKETCLPRGSNCFS